MKNCIFILLVLVFNRSSFANQAEITLVTEHLPPYQTVHEDSSVTGFSVDVISTVMQRANISYNLHSYPWIRTYNLALQKSNHCVFSLARTPDREKLFKWIGPITDNFYASVWALKRNERVHKINSVEDLKNFTVAVNENDVTHNEMLNYGLTEGDNLYVVHHSMSLLNILVTRPEIDFIIADDITIPYRAKLAGVPIELLQRVIEIKNLPLSFHLACNMNTSEEIVNKLKNSFSSIHQDGTYKEIFARWNGDIKVKK